MMEIKFRAYNEKDMFYIDSLYWFEEEGIEKIINGEANAHFAKYHIMQFTGLYDKNGKEIFEGDITKGIRTSVLPVDTIEPQYQTDVYIGKVMFKATDRAEYYIETKWGKREFYWFDSIEIIGNIYENSELLT